MMMAPIAMGTLEIVLVAWAGVLALLVAGLALASRHRRSPPRGTGQRRSGAGDRRGGAGDRRVGRPDRRATRTERRGGPRDRRTGPRDRRRVLGPA